MNEIQICNAALNYLGEVGNIVTIDPPDGTPFSETCKIYYPMALRYLLECHDWAFATTRIKPNAVQDFDSKLYGWEYGYSMPYDWVRVIGIYSEGSDFHEASEEFQIEQDKNGNYILLTNLKAPVLRYVKTIKDVTKLPNYFMQALIAQTASYLTGPLMKTGLADKMLNMAQVALETAKYFDSRNTIRKKREWTAPHLKARSI